MTDLLLMCLLLILDILLTGNTLASFCFKHQILGFGKIANMSIDNCAAKRDMYKLNKENTSTRQYV